MRNTKKILAALTITATISSSSMAFEMGSGSTAASQIKAKHEEMMKKREELRKVRQGRMMEKRNELRQNFKEKREKVQEFR